MVSDHIFPTESTTCSKNLTLVPSTTFPPFRILRRISSYFSRVTNPRVPLLRRTRASAPPSSSCS